MELIKLRTLQEKDIPSIQKYASNPAIAKMSYVPTPYPKNGAQTWFNHVSSLQSQNKSQVFTIEFTNEFAGIISLNNISFSEKKASVDYWVRADLQGKGIGSIAVQQALEIALQMGIEHYNSGCLTQNIGSKRVLLNNGFNIDKSITLTDGKYKGEEMLLLSKNVTDNKHAAHLQMHID